MPLNNLPPIVAKLHEYMGGLVFYEHPKCFTIYINSPYGYDVIFHYPDYNPVLTIFIKTGLIIIFYL